MIDAVVRTGQLPSRQSPAGMPADASSSIRPLCDSSPGLKTKRCAGGSGLPHLVHSVVLVEAWEGALLLQAALASVQ